MTNKKELINIAINTKNPKDVVTAFLANTAKEDIAYVAEKLVHIDAIYTSLTPENDELQKIEPWTGSRKGRHNYINTFSNVGTYWEIDDFTVSDMISENNMVAVFGSFTYTSVGLRITFTSPFSIKVVVENGLITNFQFMEDTYASAASFRAEGSWLIQHKKEKNSAFSVGL